MQLVLGSTSIYRKQILENAGLNFICKSPHFDESEFKTSHPDLTPRELCEALALGKAQSLKEQFPQDVILGCDQLIDLEGEILGKSHTEENAFLQLKKMSGKTHHLYTSTALLGPGGGQKVLCTTTQVTFRTLLNEEIKGYIKIENPIDCAGSYKMEKAGLVLAEKIWGPDPSAIQGLSLIDLVSGLNTLGLTYLDFWKGK